MKPSPRVAQIGLFICWVAAALLAAAAPVVRYQTGVVGSGRPYLFASPLVLVVTALWLKRRSQGLKLALFATAPGLASGLSISSLIIGYISHQAALEGFGLRIGLMAIFLNAITLPRLFHLGAKERDERRMSELLALIPSDNAEETVHLFCETTTLRLNEAKRNSVEGLVLGATMVAIGLPLGVIGGAKALNVPWWIILVGLLAIGFGALQLGRRIGVRIWKSEFGNVEAILEKHSPLPEELQKVRGELDAGEHGGHTEAN